MHGACKLAKLCRRLLHKLTCNNDVSDAECLLYFCFMVHDVVGILCSELLIIECKLVDVCA